MCDDRDSGPPLTRREVVGGAASLVVIGCAPNAQKFDVKPVETIDGIVEIDTADYPDLVTPGGMVALRPTGQRKPVLVMRLEDDRFRVLSLQCSHMGCTVRWDNSAQALVCPCHGSRFDDAGRVTAGPAKRKLDELPSQVLMSTRLQFKVT